MRDGVNIYSLSSLRGKRNVKRKRKKNQHTGVFFFGAGVVVGVGGLGF